MEESVHVMVTFILWHLPEIFRGFEDGFFPLMIITEQVKLSAIKIRQTGSFGSGKG